MGIKERVFKALTVAGVGAAFAVAGTAAQASILNIDFDGAGGAGAVQVGSLDWKVGNSLSVDGVVAGVNFQLNAADGGSRDTTFHTLFQASLLGYLDAGGVGHAVPGSGEWTLVAGFAEEITFSTGPGAGNTSGFAFDAASALPNFYEIYYDAVPDANDLAGTGFNDLGTLILSGEITSAAGNFTNLGTAPVAFDQFGANDYAAITTVTGFGSTIIDADVQSRDAAFFLDGVLDVGFSFVNTSQIVPFGQVDPSALFDDGSAAAYAPVRSSSLGLTSNLNGEADDFQFQSDANQSFTIVRDNIIPEPATASLGMLSLAALGLGAFRRRRSA